MPDPSTTWKEHVPAGEATQLEELASQLRALQRTRARGRPARRALHAKGQAGLEAELTVLPDLPAPARVGIFASPATFAAYVRVSNGAGVYKADHRPDERGLAIKLLGVPGPKIIPGLESATTQDFLFIQSATVPFRNADEFLWVVLAASRPATLLPRALVHFGPLRAIQVIRTVLKNFSRPVLSVATSRYYSNLPIKFGPYAVKLSLAPHATPEPGARPSKAPDHIGEELAARLAKGPVVYDFQIQFYVDEARTPIEDASVEWKAEDAPWLTVARLTLLQQDVRSERGRGLAELVEKLSFDPWHATADFRPLGNMMRARNAAYRVSTQERGAAAEPEGAVIRAVS